MYLNHNDMLMYSLILLKYGLSVNKQGLNSKHIVLSSYTHCIAPTEVL